MHESNIWFALGTDGELSCLGDHGDFDAAEDTAKDLGISAIWIADETTARQWWARLNQNLEGPLKEILSMHPDDDGDTILGADENGYNEMIHQIEMALGLAKPLVIEVFPMNEEGSIADTRGELNHWDVLLRPDGRDPIVEHEGLTREEADVKIAELGARYPQATVNDGLL